MGKAAPDATLDVMLDYIADNGDEMNICNAEPTTFAEANATFELGSVALSTGDGGGDYTIANGDVSGRKLSVGAQTGVSITSTDDATHIAITNGTDTLLYVTTCPSTAVSSGGTADVDAWDIEIADPS